LPRLRLRLKKVQNLGIVSFGVIVGGADVPRRIAALAVGDARDPSCPPSCCADTRGRDPAGDASNTNVL